MDVHNAMRTVVADRWHPSWYPISIGWVNMENGYDVERPETSNDPQLKASLICAKTLNQCISRKESSYRVVNSG